MDLQIVKTPSDHLILFSKKSPAGHSQDRNFFERDWSLAWTNFLLQEVGCYACSSLEDFDLSELPSYRFVYLPASLARSLESRHRPFFQSYVGGGGALIIEGPAANCLGVCGVRFSSKRKPFKKITRVEKGPWLPPLTASLLGMSFHTFGWETEFVGPEVEVALEMETSPVLFKQPVGMGCVVILGFDFGLLLTGLQQGIPVNGEYRLRKLFGTQVRVIEPEDLVLKAALLDSATPWADLFERFLFRVITAARPAPRWWYFPGTHTGGLISSHDEEAIGPDPRLESMWKEEKSRGVKGTVFVISDPLLKKRWSPKGVLREWSNHGPEMGLHWNRFPKPRLKWGRFRWGMHEEPLRAQIQVLEKETGNPVRLNRTHYLALGGVYDDHFKSLAAHGILFDSTYGPNQGGRGYLFGTGYPYYGLTWEGSLSGVLELPFLVQETWGGADLDYLKRLITESDENFHQAVVINFHPHYTVLKEKGRAAWLEGLHFAKERRQWIPTLGEFFDFFSKRSQGLLQSRFDGKILEAFAVSDHAEGTISFPCRISEAGGLSRVEVDGSERPLLKLENAWSEEALVPVPQGASRVRAFYGG